MGRDRDDKPYRDGGCRGGTNVYFYFLIFYRSLNGRMLNLIKIEIYTLEFQLKRQQENGLKEEMYAGIKNLQSQIKYTLRRKKKKQSLNINTIIIITIIININIITNIEVRLLHLLLQNQRKKKRISQRKLLKSQMKQQK